MTSHLMQNFSSASQQIVNKRTVIAVAAGIGIGIAFATVVRRWFRAKNPEVVYRTARTEIAITPSEALPPSIAKSETRQAPSVKGRPGSSQGADRASLRSSIRQNSQRSLSMNPVEADISNSQDMCNELKKTIERVYHNLEMVKNRSDKDMERSLKIETILKGLRNIEDTFSSLLPSLEDIRDDNFEYPAPSERAPSVRTGRSRTLSVLSDDSFVSAVEEFASSMEIDDMDFNSEAANLAQNELVFLQSGMNAALNGEVLYRKSRADMCNCDSETEFAAKLFCIRLALDKTLEDEHKRVWLAKCGRTLLADFIRHTKQDPIKFFNAYDEMLDYLATDQSADQIKSDVEARGVVETGFFDVVVDFIILDAFEDLKSPPSAIYSVTKNRFMSSSMKYSTINTIVWSILKTKRQRLKNPDGFIAKFYNISEAVMPAITLGFLGTDERLGELCQYFKDQIIQFVLDIFNNQKVRYRNLDEMAEDVWIVMRNRLEAVQTRMSNELLPA